ncbi:MAG: endoglucanase [Actinobacteria bacterium 13_1_20CM_3_71_11]|nr:MAG: endoglucanase [Actinobacteria bacterium 13_1_20CM_3_71_11]
MRRNHLLLGLAGLAVLGAVTLTVTTCAPPPQRPALAPSPPAGTPPIATQTGPFDAGPVRPPAAGVLLGAWVKPSVFTQPARIDAVSAFESALGRRLDIVNTYRRFDEPFPTLSDKAFAQSGRILMLSWAIDDTRVITSGTQDPAVHAWARRIRDFGHPILLRFRWEMDRPNLQAAMWSPEDYIDAWKHVRDIFAAEHTTNVSWTWCPTVEGFAGGYAQAFYPGDEDVDWTCVDAYAGRQLRPFGELLRPFLTWAADHPKPIIIGEFGVSAAWGSAGRAKWLADAATVIEHNPQIKAVSYFNSNPDGNRPDQQFLLSDDPPALAAFSTIARSGYFNAHPG